MKKAFIVAALFCSSSALAADLDFWIGLTGMQTSGNTTYVNSMIGSNEDLNSPGTWMIFTTLTVKADDGTTVCSTSVEKNMVVRPAIQPLQFRVDYPTLKVGTPILRGTRKYTVHVRFTIEGPPAEITLNNNKHQWTFDFPNGGTPSCVGLLN